VTGAVGSRKHHGSNRQAIFGQIGEGCAMDRHRSGHVSNTIEFCVWACVSKRTAAVLHPKRLKQDGRKAGATETHGRLGHVDLTMNRHSRERRTHRVVVGGSKRRCPLHRVTHYGGCSILVLVAHSVSAGGVRACPPRRARGHIFPS